MRTISRCLLGCAFVILLAPASEAHAYRTHADDPEILAPARWESTEIVFEISVAGLEEDRLESSVLMGALAAALQSLSATPCSVPTLRVAGTTPDPAASGDGRNTVAVVADDWVGRGFPSGAGAEADVRIEVRDEGAVIVEADIYLNLAAYRFVARDPEPGELDLQAVLTHEGLHCLGILHVCELDGAGGAPICEVQHRSSAVYPVYLGEGPRVLSADDVAGLCALHPRPTPSCELSCPEGSACIDGECIGVGEPQCDSGRPCAEGACAVAGNNEGFCVPPGSTGAPCERGAECSSGLCVSSAELSYCTIDCVDDAQCPGMQHCARVDERSVCAPLVGGGCGVAPPHCPTAPPVSLVCLASRNLEHARA